MREHERHDRALGRTLDQQIEPDHAYRDEPEPCYEDPEPVSVEQVEQETLRAGGMLSTVRSAQDGEQDVVGHVLMLDWDSVSDVTGRISMLDSEPGVSVLLQSSSGSYHGYNLSVRPIEQQIYRAAQTESEHGHVQSSARRDHFVLRWTPKLRETDMSTYKPAPEVIWCSITESDAPQSRPHLNALINRARESGEQEIAEQLRSVCCKTVGSSLSVEHYQTFTDEIKGRDRS